MFLFLEICVIWKSRKALWNVEDGCTYVREAAWGQEPGEATATGCCWCSAAVAAAGCPSLWWSRRSWKSCRCLRGRSRPPTRRGRGSGGAGWPPPGPAWPTSWWRNGARRPRGRRTSTQTCSVGTGLVPTVGSSLFSLSYFTLRMYRIQNIKITSEIFCHQPYLLYTTVGRYGWTVLLQNIFF